MKVISFKENGFCAGVQRIIELLMQLDHECKKVYILGEIVHNRIVNDSFKEKGVEFILIGVDFYKKLEALDKKESILVIGAHGIPKHIKNHLKEKSFTVIDGTCSIVKNVFKEINESKGKNIFFFGKPGHQEFISAISYSLTDPNIVTVDKNGSPEISFDKYLPNIDSVLIAQTTMNSEDYLSIKGKIEKKLDTKVDLKMTICPIVRKVEKNIASIKPAKNTIAFVVGSKTSSNTSKIYFSLLKLGVNVRFIEDKSEIHHDDLIGIKKTYLFGGTSTPNKTIDEVREFLVLLRDQ